MEDNKKKSVKNKDKVEKISAKPGAFPDALPDRFAPDYPEIGKSKKVKPDNRESARRTPPAPARAPRSARLPIRHP
eukprot:7377727-Prymnesium_polylepis.1